MTERVLVIASDALRHRRNYFLAQLQGPGFRREFLRRVPGYTFVPVVISLACSLALLNRDEQTLLRGFEQLFILG